MILLLVLHAALGLSGLVFGERLGRRGLLVGAAAPVVTCVWLAVVLPRVTDGRPPEQTIEWMPSLDVDLALRLDGLAAVMALLVSGIGVLVYAYAYRYFPAEREGLGRLAGWLTLFAGSMLGLVLADDLLVLYGCWELTSITSFMLIGNTHTDGRARAAALQALLVTSLGGLAMLAGFVTIGQAAGTYRISELVASPPGGTTVTVALVFVLVGAFTKSAHYPFHSWLPGAMVAPTPVSAYLHSATMVKAGVFLVARLAPAFAITGAWRPLVVTVGGLTLLAGGLRALRQNDLKLLLAMSTVSQLGLMTLVFGLGAETAAAGCVLLLGHALAKAAAFMVVGVLDRQHGSRDIRMIPRVGPGWMPTAVVTVIAAASMAGIPVALGFVAKEAAFAALVDGGDGWGAWGSIALVVAVAGSALTVAYSVRFACGALGLLSGSGSTLAAGLTDGPPPIGLVAPGLVLSVLSVVTGVWPGGLDGLLEAASTHDPHHALWHGFGTPLLLSAVVLAAGGVVFAGRHSLDPLLTKLQPGPVSSSRGYAATLRDLNSLSNRITGAVQSGSLPIYAGVILFTAVAIPGGLLLTGSFWPGWPDIVDTPAHVPIAAVILGGAVAAATVRRRFTAALFLGVTGYSMAGLFVIQGAPDLALTQVAIESLTTVLFVLVLRRLPDRFESRTPLWRRSIRIVLSGVVGATVFVLALSTGGQNPPTPAADAMIDMALPEAHGRNVVNVILVDFRGFDTLGEITVMTAAAIGMVALARAGRRPGTPDAPGQGGHAVPPPVRVARLVTLEVSMRVVFSVVMVGSLYLLFAGHNQPGGGFAGGIVAGAAVALRYISGGIGEVRRLSRGQPWTVLGSGVLVAAVTALTPLAFGRSVLEVAFVEWDLPALGHVKLSSVLAFDIGVYLVVLGLVLMMFESFGDDPPPTDEFEGDRELTGQPA